MPSANPLELAKQGDPTAIATILSYTVAQRYDATASVIRLGNYLSVFIETVSSVEQEVIVRLVYEVLSELAIEEISTAEINAHHRGDRAMLWTQTIEAPFQATPPFSFISTLSNPAIDQSSLSLKRLAPATGTLVEQKKPMDSAAYEEWNSQQTILQRPEIVAMMALALMLVFWDSYMEWMAEAETQSLSGRQLAHRLGVSSSTISRYKERTNFGEWSQTLDPQGIAWSYTGKGFMQKEARGEGQLAIGE
ncbi:MAG: hypothetical protein LH647_05085 [Leptolyngbyaceae cyanobacterium CAN_BIN12]|nr:hypothetical protein [Leptolyngbyaceae cyanobacterium CAN_BIN12]